MQKLDANRMHCALLYFCWSDIFQPSTHTLPLTLLDWLLVPGSYMNKWHGKNNGRQTKQVTANIAHLINDAGVHVTRNAKQVQNKVQHLEQQFRVAYNFANTKTGQGLESNDKNSFEDAVCGLCTQHFDLFEVFHDCASSRPPIKTLQAYLH